MNRKIKNITTLVSTDFEIDISQDTTEDELLIHLADRVAYLMENQMEYFFNILYRLDVNEQKVHHALVNESEEPVNISIAKLILEREKVRLATRLKYSSKPSGDGELDF